MISTMQFINWGRFFYVFFFYLVLNIRILIISNFKGRVKRKNQRKAAGGGAAAEDED